MKQYGVLLLAALMFNSPWVMADVFNCAGPDGRMKFQDKPCAKTDKLLGQTAAHTKTEGYDVMNKQEASTYMALVKCIDGVYYDGGHDGGDKERIKLINREVRNLQLPEYKEEEYEAFEKRIDSESLYDAKRYIEIYSHCIERQPVGDREY